MKKVLGALSPVYGVMTGEGIMGKAAREGGMGLIPQLIAKNAYEKDAEEQEANKRKAKGMKAGGYVKAADGCAKKGKTKGRIV